MDNSQEGDKQTTVSSATNGHSSDKNPPKLNGTALKSILKVKTEPILQKVESDSLPDFDSLPSPSPTEDRNLVSTISKPQKKKVHGLKIRGSIQGLGYRTTTTLSYENPAFETEGSANGDSGNTEHHLAELVDKVVVRIHDAHDWHPYGRTSMYEEMLSGKYKSGIFESEKVILWFIFTIMLLGIAGGIIFLSETYSITNETIIGNATI